MHKLTYPLPKRCWLDRISRPWDNPDIELSIGAGGWFSPNVSYDFESKTAAALAKKLSTGDIVAAPIKRKAKSWLDKLTDGMTAGEKNSLLSKLEE